MAAPAPQEFFRVTRSTAEIKEEILRQFFPVWHRLRLKAEALPCLVYADLLAGEELPEPVATVTAFPTYLPQSTATEPTALLRHFLGASSKQEMEVLKQQTESFVAGQELPYPPLLLHEPESQLALSELLAQACPALLVSDPFATPYALQLLQEASNSGGDLLLLLHPKKLRSAVTGKKTQSAAQDLFGNRLATIQDVCKREKSAQGQETFIINQLEALLREQQYFTLDFRVEAPDKDNTSLYLLFASRSVPVYKAYKEILLPYSEIQQDGVPLFGTNLKQLQQLSLFPEQLRYSVQKLADDLAQKASQYNYKTIEKIAEDHHPNTHYIKDNYRLAYDLLRAQGIVETLNPKTLQTVRKASLNSPVKYKPQQQ